MNSFFEHVFHAFDLPLQNNVLIFSILLLIILVSPILLRKLKIPSIIILIIAGLIIGPKGFNVIGENYLEQGGALKLFALIGLLYIMFIAGLELDLDQFKKYKNKSLIFGLLTFCIPLFLGYFVCNSFLGLNSIASWLTASMFATHTLVSYPILSKYGLSNLQSVAITVGGTILTDTAVLILLAVISKSSKNSGEMGTFALTLITSLLIFTAIMYFVIPRISKWFLAKLEYEKSSQYIFVIAVVFFASFLAEMAGVEPIIGAFFSGLVLNKLIPHSSRLRHQIEFVGNALFIPFFLISVGMLIDIKVIFNDFNTLYFALVLTVFAICSKWLAAFVVQQLFRLKSTDRKMIFGLSTSHAAATLAVIMVGYENNILSIQVVNGTVILILITCFVSSIVVENASLQTKINLDKEKYTNLNFEKSKSFLTYLNETSDDLNLLQFVQLLYGGAKTKILNTLHIYPEMNNEDNKRDNSELVKNVVYRSDIEINKIETVERNISEGIGKIAGDINCDIVLLNDYNHQNILQLIIGDDRAHLLQSCSKTIMFCKFKNPISEYDKLILHCPKYSDLEQNFIENLNMFINLSLELKMSITMYSTEVIFEKIRAIISKRQLLLPVLFLPETEDIYMSLDVKKENLFVEFRFRTASLATNKLQLTGNSRLEHELQKMDYIFLYPSLRNDENLTSYEKL